jgi:hypothetical protein
MSNKISNNIIDYVIQNYESLMVIPIVQAITKISLIKFVKTN